MPSFVVDAFGSAIAVDCASADVERLQAQWNRCLSSSIPVDRVTHDHHAGSQTADYALASGVTIAAITARAGTGLLLHAAGLADSRGRVAACVAPSGTGKTTATRVLCRSDFGYVSDETVAVDPSDLTVAAYPKPLSVVIAADAPMTKSQHGPDELGLSPLPAAPLRLGALIVLDRNRAGDHPARLTELDPFDAMIRLLPQSSALPSLRHPLATLARVIAAVGGCHVLEYDEVADTAALIEQALAGAAAPVTFEHLPPAPNPQPDPVGVTRREYLDAIAQDDRVLIMVGTQGMVLDGLGALIWRACERPQTEADLVRLSEEAFGPHPDAAALVTAALDDLVDYRLISRPKG